MNASKPSHSPIYNINAVLKETGINPTLLRAWERRYGLPAPSRKPGGHRLYSKYDIEIIHWLKAQLRDGLTISRAVALWRSLIDAGREPLSESKPAIDTGPADWVDSADPVEGLRKKWLEACLAFDGHRADEILNHSFALYPLETIYARILQQGLREIGESWYLGKINVQQEHFIANLIVRRLETLISAMPAPTRKQTVLLGCPAGERHSLPLLFLSVLLRRVGLNVVYLGADIPSDMMKETTARISPSMVILNAQHITTAARLRSTFMVLQDQEIPLAYGGLIFQRVPALCTQIPGHFLGNDLYASVNLVEDILLDPVADIGSVIRAETNLLLFRNFCKVRPLIEIEVVGKTNPHDAIFDHLETVNPWLGDGLCAALELGNPAHFNEDWLWMRGWLKNRDVADEGISSYLQVYQDELVRLMGSHAAELIDWFNNWLIQEAA